ncbi:MAG: hypothetical protein KDK78_00945 [Chlamydiia bacterium]|nr:hypothetical protein [Chlamydiia bacterium]
MVQRSSTKQMEAASLVLDEVMEERLRAIAFGDLTGKVIHENLEVETLSTARRIWEKMLGHSHRSELLEAARRLQRLSALKNMTADQEKLVCAAKERVRELVSQWTSREDIKRTVQAQFDGTEERERLEYKDWPHAQGILLGQRGAALNQVENTPPHHPNAGLHLDSARLCYYDNGGLAMVVTEGAREGGLGNALCAQEFSRIALDALSTALSDRDLRAEELRDILGCASQQICANYKGERAQKGQEEICMGKTGFLMVRTFPSEYPDRVDVKVVGLGYMALFYRHTDTGQIFQLTRAEKGKAGSAEDLLFRDSTTRFFNPQEDLNSYWDWVHFNEALVPMDGNFLALTSRALDNILDVSAFEAILASPVFDNEIPGPTPWQSLPTARQIKRYNEVNGHYAERACDVCAEDVVTRLEHYCKLMSRNNLSMNEEISELVEAREELRALWEGLVHEGRISHSQLKELMRGQSVMCSDGAHIDAGEFHRIEQEVDKLLEDLETIPGRAGDFLVASVPVYGRKPEMIANSVMQTLWTLFGTQG